MNYFLNKITGRKETAGLPKPNNDDEFKISFNKKELKILNLITNQNYQLVLSCDKSSTDVLILEGILFGILNKLKPQENKNESE